MRALGVIIDYECMKDVSVLVRLLLFYLVISKLFVVNSCMCVLESFNFLDSYVFGTMVPSLAKKSLNNQKKTYDSPLLQRTHRIFASHPL